jgi:hypothetical protein
VDGEVFGWVGPGEGGRDVFEAAEGRGGDGED